MKWVLCDKFYVSSIDRFLEEFDKKNPQRSQSQLAEIAKYARIFWLRDHSVPKRDTAQVWEKF